MKPLTIGVDFRPALSRATGVGRYFQGLVSGLCRVDHDNDYILFSSSWKERARSEDRPANFRLVDRRIPVRVLNALWHRLQLPSLDSLTGTELDIAHSPTPLILPSKHARSIVTMHDLFFLDRPEATAREVRRDYGRLVREHVKRASAIIANSETTACEVAEKLDVPRDRITVIHAGLDERFLSSPGRNGRGNYLLSVGTLEPRKNLPTLLDAVAVLRKRGWNGKLRIAGGAGLDSRRFDEVVGRLGLEPFVERLGYVDADALPSIYREARVFVIPSLWEGFSLPLLEAMASETPIVASDIPVHREVAGDAAVFATPLDAVALANAIESLWEDESKRKALVSQGRERVGLFSWDASARKARALYERVAGRA